MKTLFIINPAAGGNKCLKVWENIKPYIKKPFQWELTKKPGDAAKIAVDAKSFGISRIVAVGGDGTVCEVVNGIAESDVELGIIPAGTGNDFVKTLGIPDQPKEALDVIENGNIYKVDMGRHKKGYFVNVAGAGFDAQVVKIANQGLKIFKGTFAYLTSTIWNLINYNCVRAKIEIDGKIYSRKLWMVVVANGQYFGGGMKISPDSKVRDGLLDICMVKEMSRLEIFKFLPSVFRGDHKSHPAFEVIRGQHIKIDFEKPVYVQADGEIIGCTPVEFRIIPKALKVIL